MKNVNKMNIREYTKIKRNLGLVSKIFRKSDYRFPIKKIIDFVEKIPFVFYNNKIDVVREHDSSKRNHVNTVYTVEHEKNIIQLIKKHTDYELTGYTVKIIAFNNIILTDKEEKIKEMIELYHDHITLFSKTASGYGTYYNSYKNTIVNSILNEGLVNKYFTKEEILKTTNLNYENIDEYYVHIIRPENIINHLIMRNTEGWISNGYDSYYKLEKYTNEHKYFQNIKFGVYNADWFQFKLYRTYQYSEPNFDMFKKAIVTYIRDYKECASTSKTAHIVIYVPEDVLNISCVDKAIYDFIDIESSKRFGIYKNDIEVLERLNSI